MAEPAVSATLALTDWVCIRESWRVRVGFSVASARRMKDLYVAMALAKMFVCGPGGDRVVVTHDDASPDSVVVDFTNEPARKRFVHSYNNCTVELRKGVLAKLSALLSNGPTEAEWCEHFFGGVPADCHARFSELGPGRRPDTVVLRNLPCSWLSVDEDTLHSEYMVPHSKFMKMFSAFGRIADACLQVRRRRGQPFMGDVPNPAAAAAALEAEDPACCVATAIVQYDRYDAFVTAVSALSNCVFVHANGETCAADVAFDTTRFFSREVKAARVEADRLVAQQAAIADEAELRRAMREEVAERIKRQAVSRALADMKLEVADMETSVRARAGAGARGPTFAVLRKGSA